jgi:hypothetical protein
MSSGFITICWGSCSTEPPAAPQRLVAVAPGKTTWMRTFVSASSLCSDRLKARTKAFVPHKDGDVFRR